MSEKILLDPVDFDALHLSALIFEGIGSDRWWECGWGDDMSPFCIHGHACWLTEVSKTYFSAMTGRLNEAGLSTEVNDQIVGREYRLPFLEYIQRGNIDIKEVAA